MGEQQKHQNLINILIFGPLVLAPAIAVEFPRFLAYLPVISAILGAGALTLLAKQKITWPVAPAIMLGGVVALASLSVLWAFAPDVAGDRAGKLATMLPFYYLFAAVFCSAGMLRNKDVWLKAILISCAIGSLIICIDIRTDLSIYRWIRDLEGARLNDSVMNRGAVTIVMLSLLPIFYFWKENRKIAIAAFLPVFLMTTQIESQTAQLAFIFALLFYCLFPFKQNWLWALGFVAFAAYALGKPFAATWAYNHLALDYNNLAFLKQAYFGARLEIWDYVGRYAFQSPLLGHGIEVTRAVTDFDSGEVFNVGYTTILHPHSFIMQIWIEFGLVGISLAIAAFGAILKSIHGLPDEHDRKMALTIFLSSLLVTSFSYGLWQSWFLGMFCLASGIYMLARSTKNN